MLVLADINTVLRESSGRLLVQDLPWCAPELLLTLTIVALLFGRLLELDRHVSPAIIALLGCAVSLMVAGLQFWQLAELTTGVTAATDGGPWVGWLRSWLTSAGPVFGGMLSVDLLTGYLRLLILLSLLLTVALTVLSGIPDRLDGPDFYTLLLGSSVGLLFMVSTQHLLMLFLSVEMASVPGYALAGFLKGRRVSSEAALKFNVYGAGAAGLMLFGISLLAGITGTAELPELGHRLALLADPTLVGGGAGLNAPTAASVAGTWRAILLAIVLILVGLAFKLAAVPFHFWCPDVFHGAPAEVAGFLSVASKVAAFGLLLRLVIALGDSAALAGPLEALMLTLAVISGLTATLGNLAAYSQTNAKRLLAYSTVAQAGYLLMAVAAIVGLMSVSSRVPTTVAIGRAVEALLIYLAIYTFMNLGAFAVVTLIRNELFSEELASWQGLAYRSPWPVIAMGVFLFSLVGIPPLGGFFAKLAVFAMLFEAGKHQPALWWLLAVGAVNTFVSLYYYARVLRIMCQSPDGQPAVATLSRPGRLNWCPLWSPGGLYLACLALPVVWLGVNPERLSVVSRTVGREVAVRLRAASQLNEGGEAIRVEQLNPVVQPLAMDPGR
jgi:NADH-quinone oxidoreductase subunit N